MGTENPIYTSSVLFKVRFFKKKLLEKKLQKEKSNIFILYRQKELERIVCLSVDQFLLCILGSIFSRVPV